MLKLNSMVSEELLVLANVIKHQQFVTTSIETFVAPCPMALANARFPSHLVAPGIDDTWRSAQGTAPVILYRVALA